jgi:hypothetical protein
MREKTNKNIERGSAFCDEEAFKSISIDPLP